MANQELLEYIKQQKEKGVPTETITSDLLSQGWQSADIEEGVAVVNAESPSEEAPTNTVESKGSTGTFIVLSVLGILIAGGAVYFAAQMLLNKPILPDMGGLPESELSAETESTETPVDTQSIEDEDKEPVEENLPIVFTENISSCTPATHVHGTSESTGQDLVEEVVGMVDGLCEYVIELGGDEPAERKCTMTKSERQVIAQYYKDFIAGEHTDSTVYVMNGKEVNDPFQEATATGICVAYKVE